MKSVSFKELSKNLQGRVLTQQDGGYDEARRIFNAMIDRRPMAIAQCASTSDVALCVSFSREHDLPISVRGGGHNVAGSAVCGGGLMIDLSRMKGIEVDTNKRVARAQTGMLLGDFDHATQAHGLATTLGVISKTGIAGLTLGGGYGWLSGKYGLACDNVISAEVVTAAGRVLQASETENSDLFWAIRGAGANFGVTTRLDYRLHPVDSIFAGLLIYPAEKAREVLRFYQDFSRAGKDEQMTFALLGPAPDGTPVAGIALGFCGTPSEDARLRHRFSEPGQPLADLVARRPYLELQSMLDAAYPPGRRHYWKAAFLNSLPTEAMEVLVEAFVRRPSALSSVMLEHWHGAAMRVPASATAFPHRAERFNLGILGVWESPAEDEENLAWVREVWQAVQPFAASRTYANYLSEGEGRVQEAYGPNYSRLAELKAKYDPANVFRCNQNILPSGQQAARAD